MIQYECKLQIIISYNVNNNIVCLHVPERHRDEFRLEVGLGMNYRRVSLQCHVLTLHQA